MLSLATSLDGTISSYLYFVDEVSFLLPLVVDIASS